MKNRNKRFRYDKKYYRKHKAKILKQKKEHYLRCKDKILKYCKKYQKNHEAEYKKTQKEWQSKHKNYCKKKRLENRDNRKCKVNKTFREWRYKKYHADPCFKLIVIQRSRIRVCIKRIKAIKENKTLDLLGCTAEELKKHLESLWTEGMNWNNYGLYGWHVDHVKPLCSFDLTDSKQQKTALHYTNLQPLWAKDNLRKRKSLTFKS